MIFTKKRWQKDTAGMRSSDYPTERIAGNDP
jgi:hypothetical protein